MTDIRVEIQGLKEAQAKMEQVARGVHGSPMVDAMRKATMIVDADAKRNTPVDTGRLRASIMPEVRVTGVFNTTVQGVVGSNVKYAPFVEEGSGPAIGNPSYSPPEANVAGWAHRHGVSAYSVVKAIRRSGTKAHKYLEKALVKNASEIRRLLSGALEKIADK